MTIERYLTTLRRWLGSGPRARRILREIEDHLEDAREGARSIGISPDDAERIAVQRFGSPVALAFDFYRRTPLVLLERVQAHLLVLSTLITLIFAGSAVFFTTRAMVVESISRWSFVQLGMSAFFSTIVVVVWAALLFRVRPLVRVARASGPWVLGLGILGMGLATFFGLTTGDWEYYLYVMNGNIIVMGFLMERTFSRSATK